MLAAASAFESSGRMAEADAIYRALVLDQDIDVRAEAMYRLAKSDERRGDNKGAIRLLEQVIALKPKAGPPHIDLARLLNAEGDDVGARRELRIASSAGLPPDVSQIVDRFQQALRSRQMVGGSLEAGIAPDSNINHATRHDIMTVLGPLIPDQNASGQSGIGAAIAANAFARSNNGPLSFLARVAFQGNLYGRSEFDDLTASVMLGPEFGSSKERWQPSLTYSRRWFGGKTYSQYYGISADWLRLLTKTSQMTLSVSALRSLYVLIPGQTGAIYSLGANFDRAITPRLSARLSLDLARQSSQDPGYATTEGGVGALVAYNLGRVTVFSQGYYSRLAADARLSLFPRIRDDKRIVLMLGGVFNRRIAFDAKPLVRFSRTVNISTVDLYRYRQTRVEIGFTRDF